MATPPAILKDFATPPQGRRRVGPFTDMSGRPDAAHAAAAETDGTAPAAIEEGQEYEPFAAGPDPDAPLDFGEQNVEFEARAQTPVIRQAVFKRPSATRIEAPQPKKRSPRATITAGGLRLSVPVVGVNVCKYGFAVRMSEDSDSVLFEPTVGTEVAVTWDGKEYLGYFPGLAFSLNGELVLVFVAKEAQ